MQGISGIVPSDTFIVGIHFQDIFGTIGIVLKTGEAIDQAAATLMDE